MSNLWKILNAPLIVVIIALSIWPILTVLSSGVAVKLGMKQISEAVSEEVVKPFQKMGSEQDDKLKKEARVLEKVVVSNIGFAPTSWPGKVKIIGTITNNSGKTVKGIYITSSLYQMDRLINVNDKWLARLKVINPGASADFSFTTDVEEGQNKENLKVKVKVADLGILE